MSYTTVVNGLRTLCSFSKLHEVKGQGLDILRRSGADIREASKLLLASRGDQSPLQQLLGRLDTFGTDRGSDGTRQRGIAERNLAGDSPTPESADLTDPIYVGRVLRDLVGRQTAIALSRLVNQVERAAPQTVPIPEGPFLDSEKRMRDSAIASGFRMAVTPVTNDQYYLLAIRFGLSRRVAPPPWAGLNDLPVVSVEAQEAREFARLLGVLTERQLRLPKTSEWLQTARGPHVNLTEIMKLKKMDPESFFFRHYAGRFDGAHILDPDGSLRAGAFILPRYDDVTKVLRDNLQVGAFYLYATADGTLGGSFRRKARFNRDHWLNYVWGGRRPGPVMEYPAGVFGLYGLAGNVREWADGDEDPTVTYPMGGSWKSSWFPLMTRVALPKKAADPSQYADDIGFRLAEDCNTRGVAKLAAAGAA